MRYVICGRYLTQNWPTTAARIIFFFNIISLRIVKIHCIPFCVRTDECQWNPDVFRLVSFATFICRFSGEKSRFILSYNPFFKKKFCIFINFDIWYIWRDMKEMWIQLLLLLRCRIQYGYPFSYLCTGCSVINRNYDFLNGDRSRLCFDYKYKVW